MIAIGDIIYIVVNYRSDSLLVELLLLISMSTLVIVYHFFHLISAIQTECVDN